MLRKIDITLVSDICSRLQYPNQFKHKMIVHAQQPLRVNQKFVWQRSVSRPNTFFNNVRKPKLQKAVRSIAATVEHGQAIYNISFLLRTDNDSRWIFAPRTVLQLLTGDCCHPDIMGFRKPIKFGSGRAVTQKPDWICEITSAQTQKQDSPGGDKFFEYKISGIPHFWIVDYIRGSIDVFRWKAEKYELISSASVNDKSVWILEPFDTKLNLDVVFDYLFD